MTWSPLFNAASVGTNNLLLTPIAAAWGRIHALTDQGLFVSLDDGHTFRAAEPLEMAYSYILPALLALDPSHPGRLLMATPVGLFATGTSGL